MEHIWQSSVSVYQFFCKSKIISNKTFKVITNISGADYAFWLMLAFPWFSPLLGVQHVATGSFNIVSGKMGVRLKVPGLGLVPKLQRGSAPAEPEL